MSPVLGPEEELVARLQPHARVLVAPVVALAVVAAAVAYLWGVLPERWMGDAAAAIGAVVVLVGALPPIARWARTSYLVTTERVLLRRGVLRRHRDELELAEVVDVRVVRRGGQRLGRRGDVEIVPEEGEALVFADVPRARLVAAAILELLPDEPNEPDDADGLDDADDEDDSFGQNGGS